MKATDSRALPPRGKGKITLSEAVPTDLDTKLQVIQMLIPIALERVHELLRDEVIELAGARYARNDAHIDYKRWGKQRGSVHLGGQKVPLVVPRVRDLKENREIPLLTYQGLQHPALHDEKLFLRVLHGLSCRDYESTARLVPEAFGLSGATVSRRFIRTSAKKLHDLFHRRLDDQEFVALVLDGKTFRKAQMIVALGITKTGYKLILGFIESATENSRVVADFLKGLISRGLHFEQGLLVVMDGSKGLRKAVTEVFGDHAAVQRCQWHKRENVVAYLPKSQQVQMRQKLQRAYEQPTYQQAKEQLSIIRRELLRINQSAAASLDEGFEETLTLHRLGLFKELGVSLKTTNCLESINSQIKRMTRNVSSWRNSEQRHRWLASALLDIEPRLRRIRGFRALTHLQIAVQRHLNLRAAIAA